jgi:crotonobetainyl-CoA:carnitine CoA-transferase CaiB-like acyl-CoA transferase
MLANHGSAWLTAGKLPERLGNAHPSIVPYQAFETKDSHLVLAIGNDGQFQRFCDYIGCSDWIQDPRFATNKARVENRNLLLPEIENIMRQKETEKWLEIFDNLGIPCGPINQLNQVFQDPHVQEREIVRHCSHPLAGQVSFVGTPIWVDGMQQVSDLPPPLFGEHTESVFSI